MKQAEHVWSFSTVGGVKRVNLESGADLLHLAELDPKLWTALSCPVNGLEIDKRTLELIDADNDGQIRVPEIIEAVNWICSLIKNPDDLLKQDGNFHLSAIDSSSVEGKVLHDSAQTILKNIGKEDLQLLTVSDTSDLVKIFAGTRFNGDGIITEDSADSEALKKVISEIRRSVGSLVDRGGKEGVSKEVTDKFFDLCKKYSDWQAKKEAELEVILPFGEQTEEAYDNFKNIKAKLEDFYIRCRLASFDAQTTNVLNLQMARVESISAMDLSKCMDEIAAYPIAKIEAEGSLPLGEGINPAWEKQIEKFKKLTLKKLFPNHKTLSENDWSKVKSAFKAYAKWCAEKEGTEVEGLGISRVRDLLHPDIKAELDELFEQEASLSSEADHIILVDKLVRYHRDIFTLLKNFVTFFDFYTPGSKAIFQAGTLYIDQRSCTLCIKVSDMAKHAAMVSFSGMYLIYCECVSRATNEKMMIVAALTNGDIDNLVVGKNALFYDRAGLDWDATVTKIVDNPISIRQAFFSPYRKVSRFIENQINKVAASQEEKVSGDLNKGIESLPTKAEEVKAKKDPPPPFDVGKFVGIFAAIGLAIGAIGTALASVVAGFMGLVWWKMPFALLGLILLISGPSMIIAYLKLRKRNLAPILDANGWAINARAIVNIQFGNTLTQLAELPKGAKINLNDPFTKKKRPLLPAIFILSIIAGIVLYILWKMDLIHIHF